LENLEQKNTLPDNDPTASSRKRDHIALTFKSQVTQTDTRFYYEPLFAAHPEEGSLKSFLFLDKTFKAPLWVSSMVLVWAWVHVGNFCTRMSILKTSMCAR
jgi:isopentenyl-diphosphate Delta-isomerase